MTFSSNHAIAPTQHSKRRFFLTSAALSAAMMLCATSPASAEGFGIVAGGGSVNLDIENMRERKFATVIRQQFDFSCGSAAVATLLTHHYDRKTSETDAFKAMWEVGDQDRIKTVGFSLLEMKAYLETLDYRADGFKLTLDRIDEIGVPGIALIDTKGYKHFVVIKGITPKTVLIGDPSTGLTAVTRKDFAKMWDGIILFIRTDVKTGKLAFNARKDWRRSPSAPYDRAQDMEPLSSYLLAQTRPFLSLTSVPSVVE